MLGSAIDVYVLGIYDGDEIVDVLRVTLNPNAAFAHGIAACQEKSDDRIVVQVWHGRSGGLDHTPDFTWEAHEFIPIQSLNTDETDETTIYVIMEEGNGDAPGITTICLNLGRAENELLSARQDDKYRTYRIDVWVSGSKTQTISELEVLLKHSMA